MTRKKLEMDNIQQVIEAVKKYNLNIESKNPLKNIVRLLFSANKTSEIDMINIDVITSKISEIFQEQVYTAMLEKRPTLLLFCGAIFLHKKIVLDPNDNVFKKTFLDFCEFKDDILLDAQNIYIAFYWNFF